MTRRAAVLPWWSPPTCRWTRGSVHVHVQEDQEDQELVLRFFALWRSHT